MADYDQWPLIIRIHTSYTDEVFSWRIQFLFLSYFLHLFIPHRYNFQCKYVALSIQHSRQSHHLLFGLICYSLPALAWDMILWWSLMRIRHYTIDHATWKLAIVGLFYVTTYSKRSRRFVSLVNGSRRFGILTRTYLCSILLKLRKLPILVALRSGLEASFLLVMRESEVLNHIYKKNVG